MAFTQKKRHLRRLGWNWKKNGHLSNPKGPKIGKKTPEKVEKKTPPLRINQKNLKVALVDP